MLGIRFSARLVGLDGKNRVSSWGVPSRGEFFCGKAKGLSRPVGLFLEGISTVRVDFTKNCMVPPVDSLVQCL